MGYMHIDNLYKYQDILNFKRLYALEKIHGTSAHIKWKEGKLSFYSGGESHSKFLALFNVEALEAIFKEKFLAEGEVTVFGEAYGGSQQRMSATYGPDLKFVVFDIKIGTVLGESWLTVPKAHKLAEELGLEFVHYAEINATIDEVNFHRDAPSLQAARNGIAEPKLREGVVLRPLTECTDHRGNRIMAKHKRAEFSERGSPNVELDPSRREKLENAEAIAKEWVTPMRVEHVIDQLIRDREDKTYGMPDIPEFMRLMGEDVAREAAGEIEDNKAARKAIGARAVIMFKQKMMADFEDANMGGTLNNELPA